jgi:uncharacterized OsmC-like protein
MRYRVVVTKTPERGSRFDLGAETIQVDTTAKPTGALPGPADLLTAAFAACVLKNVDRFSKILPFSYSAAEIDVTAERQESPPRMKRIDYVLRITTDEPWRRVDLLHRNIVAHGTVFNTLRAACDVQGEIVRIPRMEEP